MIGKEVKDGAKKFATLTLNDSLVKSVVSRKRGRASVRALSPRLLSGPNYFINAYDSYHEK
jgi:hypothetical protein